MTCAFLRNWEIKGCGVVVRLYGFPSLVKRYESNVPLGKTADGTARMKILADDTPEPG